MAEIFFEGVSFGYGRASVVIGLHMKLQAGSITAVCGPSGVGKTTVLMLAAGLLRPTGGEIREDSETVNASGRHVSPHRRSVGFMFQEGSLWPHLSVRRHLEFVLRARKVPRSEWATVCAQILEPLAMLDFAERKPLALSGGQQQRLNLARALVGQPRLLLLDEPMNHLDEHLRDVAWRLVEAHAAKGNVVLVAVHRAEALPRPPHHVVQLPATSAVVPT